MNNNESIKREYPEQPIASVSACIFKDDKILIIQRADPPSPGLWTIPGGAVELGETIQEAVKREVEEECGIEIEVGDVFHVRNLIVPDNKGDIQFHYVITWMLAYYKSGEARAGSDAQDIKWVSAQELYNFDMPSALRENMIKAFQLAGIAI